MPAFRVHFDNGAKAIVYAATAEQARHIARKQFNNPIVKIKLVRGPIEIEEETGDPEPDPEANLIPIPEGYAEP